MFEKSSEESAPAPEQSEPQRKKFDRDAHIWNAGEGPGWEQVEAHLREQTKNAPPQPEQPSYEKIVNYGGEAIDFRAAEDLSALWGMIRDAREIRNSTGQIVDQETLVQRIWDALSEATRNPTADLDTLLQQVTNNGEIREKAKELIKDQLVLAGKLKRE